MDYGRIHDFLDSFNSLVHQHLGENGIIFSERVKVLDSIRNITAKYMLEQYIEMVEECLGLEIENHEEFAKLIQEFEL